MESFKYCYNITFTILFIFSFAIFPSCQNKEISPSNNKIPFKLFEPFVENPEVNEQLFIPFLENKLYGISNYDGKVILEPQFKEIKMISFSLPFFWAGDREDMTLRDLSGQEILDDENLPVSFHAKNRVRQIFIKVKEEGDGMIQKFFAVRNNKIKKREKFELSKDELKKKKFIFLTQYTKPPYQFYEYVNYQKHSRYTYSKNGKWDDSFVQPPIKVIDANGKTAQIDQEGKAIEVRLKPYAEKVKQEDTIVEKLARQKKWRSKGVTENLLKYQNKKNKYGVLDRKGNIVLPFEYTDVMFLQHSNIIQTVDYFAAAKGSTYHVYNKEGEKLSDLEFYITEGNKIQTSYTRIGAGRVYHLRSPNTEHLIDYQLRILFEKALETDDGLLNQSDFTIEKATDDILADYKDAERTKGISSFVIFQGSKYAHVFDTHKNYLYSIAGKYKNNEFFYRNSLNYGDSGIEPLAIGKFRKKGRDFWVRLIDGKTYAKN